MFNSIITFSVNNRVASNLLMLAILIVGTFSYFNTRRSLFPDANQAWIQIHLRYSGAQPEIVEREVSTPLEKEIAKLETVDLLLSSSMEEISVIWVRVKSSVTDMLSVQQELRRIVNQVDLPKIVENPVIFNVNYTTLPIIQIGIYGGKNEDDLVTSADYLEKEFENMNGINQVELFGKSKRQLHVEVNPVRLSGYGLTLDHVSQALKLSNIESPGGKLKIGIEEFSLRINESFSTIKDIEETPILFKQSTQGQGIFKEIRIKDVANVVEIFKKHNIRTTMNGDAAIIMNVQKSDRTDSIDIINQLKEAVKRVERVVPEGVKITLFNDSSKDIKRLIKILEYNSIIGFILVIISLWVVIGYRQAFFATLGIPIAFSFTFTFLYYYHYSLNQLTLFGMILVLGMVVDDAIIVIENVYRYMEKGFNRVQATILGIKEIVRPVTCAILTTLAAFGPTLLMGGQMGKVFKFIPLVVCVTLIGSLIECFLILPSHLADGAKLQRNSENINKKLKKITVGFAIYVIRNRLLMTFIFFAATGLSIFFLAIHGRELFSNEDLRSFRVGIQTPLGTRLEQTNQIIRKCSKMIQKKYGQDLHTIAGFGGIFQEDLWGVNVHRDTNAGQIFIELKDHVNNSLNHYIELIEVDLKKIPGIKSYKMIKLQNAPIGAADINIVVRCSDLKRLKGIANYIKYFIGKIDGVKDIDDDHRESKQQIRIKINEQRAARVGFSKAAISFAVYRAFEGEKVGTFHGKEKDIDIYLNYQKNYRKKLSDLENLQITAPDGHTVRISEVADIYYELGPTVINHYNQSRTTTVMAYVDEKIASADKINKHLGSMFPVWEARYPGVTIQHTGAYDDLKESFSDMFYIMLFSVFLVYAILATQFKSFSQPLLIMAAIPFCLIGVAVSMLIGQNPLSLFIFIGIVGLSGVVVNDSLILIDFINKNINAGKNLPYSILDGISKRVRPIMFTTITTIVGLLPAAIGLTGKSLVWQPLAQSFIGGMIVATFSTLFILPILYIWLHNVRGALKLK